MCEEQAFAEVEGNTHMSSPTPVMIGYSVVIDENISENEGVHFTLDLAVILCCCGSLSAHFQPSHMIFIHPETFLEK